MRTLVFLLVLFCDFAMASPQVSQEDLKSAKSIMDNMINNSKQPEIQRAANKINEIYESDKFQRDMKTYQDQMVSSFGFEKKTEKDQVDRPQLVNDQLVLFVSSSMPLQTLRAYARDLAKVGGVMMLRGGVNGFSSVKDTMKFSWDVLKANPTCEGAMCRTFATEILFDPVLFSLYKINRVPALIYQENMRISSYCDGTENAVLSRHIVYGDAYLGNLIDKLSEISGDNKLLDYKELLN